MPPSSGRSSRRVHPTDRYAAGEADALSPAARRGHDLFFGKAGCDACHGGFLFTNQRFENKGLALADVRADSGRARITGLAADYGQFKTPSLRGVGETAPYMHDGRYATLADVIEHYDRGGDGVRGQSPDVRPLHLTEEEKTALVAFLESLTDEPREAP